MDRENKYNEKFEHSTLVHLHDFFASVIFYCYGLVTLLFFVKVISLIILMLDMDKSLYIINEIGTFGMILLCLSTSVLIIINTLKLNLFVFIGFKNLLYFSKYIYYFSTGFAAYKIKIDMEENINKELILLSFKNKSEYFKDISKVKLLNFNNISSVDFKEFLLAGCYNFNMTAQEYVNFNNKKMTSKLSGF
jgi:hypothetical protein